MQRFLREPSCPSWFKLFRPPHVEKLSIFSSNVSVELFLFSETEKSATNSVELFIISSFTANSENQWVVFFSPY